MVPSALVCTLLLASLISDALAALSLASLSIPHLPTSFHSLYYLSSSTFDDRQYLYLSNLEYFHQTPTPTHYARFNASLAFCNATDVQPSGHR
ncbi:hypothetical protein M422DRAFT_32216 [Sphaerobolus stellatus SS14]|uniref:Uncharacterized protein n=1 Tax=Sphaerobolus stellatus (strain SS14) TaxID=990650 RepID=A0A0C9V0E5_SPHS4|nr:hypothetical protein M422DRAFT_32216 [Sphaerobolus stellatus SS14]